MAERQGAISVLNSGYVRLVSHMGDDLAIVRSARVSYNAEPRLDGSDDKLIDYLLRNGHTSPFESVAFTFEVKAPIFVFRQWHRHRTWKYNEVSARYSELPAEFYVPEPQHVGIQSKTNKQGRELNDSGEKNRYLCDEIWMAGTSAFKSYRLLLEAGCPRELARTVLPLNTYSRMFATVDLHNLFHFLKLRLHPHAQFEIRVYAEAMLKLITPIVPVAVKSFHTHILGERNEQS